MTMRERIDQGKLFTDYCEGLPEDRLHCKKTMAAFNRSEPDDPEKRFRLMQELFGKETKAWIELPAGKTVIRNFLGTGMISVMPVLLLSAHPRE